MSTALPRVNVPTRGRPPTVGLRASILRSAETVFTRREFHAVVMDDIARQCGVGKGTLYRYFASKEELFLAVVREGLEQLRAELGACVETDADPVAKLEAIVRRIFAHFWNRPFLLALIQREEHQRGTAGRSWLRRRADLARLVQRVIDEGIATGSFRATHARLASEMLLGMVRAMNRYRAPGDTIDGTVAAVMSVFLSGIGNGAASAAQLAPRRRVLRARAQ